MNFTYNISVDVERITGKFATRDEIQEVLATALDEALSSVDVTGIGPDCESEYEVSDFSVDYTGK